jgi:hypothetical protein
MKPPRLALVAGATEGEITGVLLAIGPVAGLRGVVGGAPGVAYAHGYPFGHLLTVPPSSRQLTRDMTQAGPLPDVEGCPAFFTPVWAMALSTAHGGVVIWRGK